MSLAGAVVAVVAFFRGARYIVAGRFGGQSYD